MRKSLSYKILAALMAAGSFGLYAATPAAADVQLDVQLKDDQLRANGNAIVIEKNKLTKPNTLDLSSVSEVYGIGSTALSADTDYYTGNTDGGNVEINDSTFGWVYGGYTDGNNDTATANNNTVTLNGSNIDYVYGGHSGHRSANVNTVTITGGKYDAVVGGQSGNNADSNVVSISNAAINRYIIGGEGGTANYNIVKIIKSAITENSGIPGWALTGGYASSGSASYNQIIITDSTISGNVYGCYIVNATNQLAENNSITVTGNSNITNANLYGYDTNSGATGSNNTLTLNGWSGSTQSVQNFNNINFENIKWNNDGTVLNITGNTEKDALANTNIKLNKLNFSGGTQLNTGDSMTFVKGTDLGINATKVTIAPEFTAGVATVGTGDVEVDENSIKYTLTEVKQNDQIYLVAENRAVAAAFVNQGTDLITDSLDTISRDDNYGVKTFAAVHGNRSKYDVNSDIKINGGARLLVLATPISSITAVSSAGACSTKTAAATTAPITSLTMSSSAVMAALFTTAAALRHATPIKTVFIRKAASVPVC